MAVAIIILFAVLVFAGVSSAKKYQTEGFSADSSDYEKNIDDFIYLDIISDGELDGDWD